MALDGDPYRILGLASGAPLAEVKRAYRRLAKANHPDTAGEIAVPRFLAIQAAYEALVGGEHRSPGRAGGGRTGPWQADPERARTTRESWQRGPRRPSGADADDAGPGTPRPPSGGTTGAERADGEAADGTGAGRSRRRRRAGGTRRTGEERPPDRATPGSTSYDFADEPFDPEWSGASWYGQSSGTYWTINPKEYADPRKHGPEYQARGRRRAGAGDEAPQPDPIPEARRPVSDESTDPAAEPRPEPVARASHDATARTDWSRGRAPRAAGPRVARDLQDPLPIAALPWSTGPGGRLALALIGWPPIGVALALLLGEVSGCGRLAASCVEEISVGSWFGQVAIVAVLLLVPPLAAVAAAGTVAILGAAIPTVVVLTALGGAYDRVTAGSVLLAVLAVAWACGVGFAALRRSRTVPP